ncbi:hypothetical protein PPYR_10106 [Photinus pyralis]|uniref:Amino acid transporter transmembrane domain-containing protein n=1 Tax=Photinus pyralis TaxID=7054 RepID=A0A1Y1K3P5_PHOPY|nr:putative sodium-coupled neutral amino acid transporter 10 [Photinus pyralis]KAB0796045.1 hypothetical protein PPYR_10106 [Photinus pyralis]
MDSQAVHVMTITNSIIGVSLLAMPYCFKQCGILLSVCMLVLSNAIARLCCHLMLKSAVIARRRTFEFLAFHTFGSLGKFTIEIGLIGFLLGTSIAYFVVMGDLGPAIIAKLADTKATDLMRTCILFALATFCVLPLGLLRNIDSLSSVCTITVGFYFCFVLKIIAEAVPHILSGDWINRVELWRPSGILQCLPIFSMALSCQTQIFEIYQALPTASLEKMNNLIRAAVNICTGVYIFVGVFGYIAFATQTFTGNILMSFSPSLISELIKIGFVLSLAFSFPLIIFPCRASLNSLLCRHYSYSSLHDGIDKYIPESRFKALTCMIIAISLTVGILIPNIELVLGLLGSTIGVMICVLFPATCFICVSTKNTNERILAQIMLFVGVLTMVLGTYANLYAMDELTSAVTEKTVIELPKVIETLDKIPNVQVLDENLSPKSNHEPNANKEVIEEIRHEPPQPIEPVVDEIPEAPKEVIKENEQPVDKKSDEKPIAKEKEPDKPPKKTTNSKKVEEVDIEAIKKEEKEIFEDEKQKLKVAEEKNIDLLKKMEKQNEVQQKVVEESKKILEELKQRQIKEEKIKDVEMEKRKAAEEIQLIANKAIERLKLADTKNEVEKKNETLKPNMSIPLVLSRVPQKLPDVLPGIKTTIKPVMDVKGVVEESKRNKTNSSDQAKPNEVVLDREIRSVDDKMPVVLEDSAKKTEVSCKKETVTKPSLVKLITKLSDSELVKIKLPALDSVNLDVEPLKRDLKSYKNNKK